MVSVPNLNKFLSFILLLFAIYFASVFYADPDLWGHVKYGIDTIEQKKLLRNDIYSYSSYGAEWINHEWLSEVIFGFFYKMFGVPGLTAIKAFLCLFIFGTIYKFIRSQSKYVFDGSFLFIVIVFYIAPFVSSLRPQLFSFLFAGIYLYLFKDIMEKNIIGLREIMAFPIIMVFWVNLHGGCISGIGLLSLFLVTYSIDKKHFSYSLLSALLLTAAVTLINPYGYKLYKILYVPVIVSRPIIEWKSLGMKDVLEWAFIILSLLIFSISAKRKTITETTLLAAAAFLSIRHIRLLPFFLISCAMVMPQYFENVVREKSKILPIKEKKMSLAGNIVITVCFIILSGALLMRIFNVLTKPFFNIKKEYPVKAVKYIKDNDIKGNLLSYFDWAQYAIWHLYPECRIFYDGRYDTVYGKVIENDYFSFHFAGRGCRTALDGFPTEIIIWKKDGPPVKLLEEDKRYKKIYEDDLAVIFVIGDKASAEYLSEKNKAFALKDNVMILP